MVTKQEGWAEGVVRGKGETVVKGTELPLNRNSKSWHPIA
jgi:hypothetical protein